MAVTTTAFTSNTTDWTDLGAAAPMIVQNGTAWNVFAFADVKPTDLVDGFRIAPTAPLVMATVPTGWTSTHLWVIGQGGAGNVIVAK